MRGSAVRPSNSPDTITAEARVAASRPLKRALERKLISPGCACSSEPTCATRVAGSPATRPPRRRTISASVSAPGMASLRRRLALIQRPDHLVGDVDARAREDGVLEDDVELLLLGDLADHAVGLLHHLRQLLVAALVEVLAELALLALELAVQVAELALPAAPLRVAHGHGVLVQVVLHALELAGDLRQLLVALLELGLDLLLRALRRNGVAQDALGVDEAELARLPPGGKHGEGEGCGEEQCAHERVLQKPVPKVNCSRCTSSPGFRLSGKPIDRRSGPNGDSHDSATPVE